MSSRSQAAASKQADIAFDYSETAASEDEDLLVIERSPERRPADSSNAASALASEPARLFSPEPSDVEDEERIISSPPAPATPLQDTTATRDTVISPLESLHTPASSTQESMLGSMVLLEPISSTAQQPTPTAANIAASSRARYNDKSSFLPYNRCTSTTSWWVPLLYSRGAADGSAPPSKPRWLLLGAVVMAAVVGFASYLTFGPAHTAVAIPSNAVTRTYVTSQQVIHHPRYSRA